MYKIFLEKKGMPYNACKVGSFTDWRHDYDFFLLVLSIFFGNSNLKLILSRLLKAVEERTEWIDRINFSTVFMFEASENNEERV